MKPNFIVIGAARSGTTSLYRYLEFHPEIFMSETKEINFFSNTKYWNKGIHWYESHFRYAAGKAVGEASTSYTNYPAVRNVPERIYTWIPDVKLIYLLRDPLERLVSHYLHRVHRGVEFRSIEQVLNDSAVDHLLWQGRYAEQLKQYLAFFPLSRILVTTVNELKEKPAQTIEKIFNFLEVDPAISSTAFRTRYNVNATITRKNRIGRSILRFYRNCMEQSHCPYKIKKCILKTSEIGAKKIDKPVFTDDQLHFLREYYRPDVLELKQLTGMDLKGWHNY